MNSVKSKFNGRKTVSVDAKGRLAFPAQWREVLRLRDAEQESGMLRTMYATEDTDGRIRLYPYDHWISRIDDVRAMDINDAVKEDLLWALAEAETCEIDKQGRIRLPKDLVKYAGIKRDAICVGLFDVVDVWSPENYDKCSVRRRKSQEEAKRNAKSY